MKPYLLEFSFESSVVLPQGKRSFTFRFGAADTQLQIFKPRETLDVTSPDEFRIRIIVEAESWNEAEQKGRGQLRRVLSALAYVTSSSFSYPRCVRVTDWSTDVETRTDRILRYIPNSILPRVELNEAITKSVETMLENGHFEIVWKALDWFNQGLETEDIDRKFHCYWLSIETLAEGIKGVGKVAHKCSKCRSDLFCESCQTHPTHRPFVAQKIHQLMSEVVDDGGKLYEQAVEARHKIAHGGKLVDIEARKSYANLVDPLARAAMQCIWSVACIGRDVQLETVDLHTYNPLVARVSIPIKRKMAAHDGKLLVKELPEVDIYIRKVGETYQLLGADVPEGISPILKL